MHIFHFLGYISGTSGDRPVDAKQLSEGEVKQNFGDNIHIHTESHLKAEMWWQVLNNGTQSEKPIEPKKLSAGNLTNNIPGCTKPQ